MKTVDQCPSTRGEREIPEAAPSLGTVSGRKYWRSLDEFAGTPEFREFVEREFPAGASELAEGETRRTFLKLMAASAALAGAATIPGCRRPDHKILAYSANEPEFVVPGKPLYYATSMPLPGGGAEGLLVETHGARPTKIEGNPLHPLSRGKSSVFAQAEILRLYDPDRLKEVRLRENPGDAEKTVATYDDFKYYVSGRMAEHEADGGEGLAIVLDKKSGPTFEAMADAIRRRFPRATVVLWDPVDARRSEIRGTEIAFERPMRVRHDFSRAGCIVSFDADFLDSGPFALENARGWAASRTITGVNQEMSRLYVAEAAPTGTGSVADHRMALAPSEITRLALAVARGVVARRPGSAAGLMAAFNALELTPPESVGQNVVDAIVDDLLTHADAARGSAVLVAGPAQPPEVHAVVAAANRALGAIGISVGYIPMGSDEASDPFEQFGALAEALGAGRIRTLVTVGTNPVYDAPAGAVPGGFAEAYRGVETTIAWSVEKSETAEAAMWELNGAHVLESWGDTEAADGTIAPVQPLIAPLYEPAHSEVEFMAWLSGVDEPVGYELVREVWAQKLGVRQDSDAFGKAFRRSLHDGVLSRTIESRLRSAEPRQARIAAALRGWVPAGERSSGSMEVVFAAGRVGDGRYANCGWLQELPQIGTSVCWDNPVLMSPRTAERLRLLPVGAGSAEDELDGIYTRAQFPQARVATLSLPDGAGGTLTSAEPVPVWILPGMADGVVQLTLGYGRREVGRVGYDVGQNHYRLRTAATRAGAVGASAERAAGRYEIASTQNHWSLEGRTSIVRAMDKKWFDKHGDHVAYDPDKIYGTNRRDGGLNVAEQLGELSHTPDNVSIYKNPLNESRVAPEPGSAYSKPPQWGMTIDLGICTGCGVCTAACQAENNIPIVGKQEVMKGREMAWIRVDRYFVGDSVTDPVEVLHQPVACVHCENAPCETVCPVNATVHGDEGTNNMAYNRCIGTRYCANNCPYKVRRFNFFDYAQTKYNGEFAGSTLLFGEEGIDQRRFNKNFIPPRLREKLDEISHMRMNPDVTVRGRGVMEKCSYCIQRVNAARQEVKIRGIWDEAGQTAPIPDGFFQTACQQACPTDAIVFGDLLDPESRVAKLRESARSYLLLGYLNTRARTSYLMRVRNPNPAIFVYDAEDPLHGHGSHGGDGHDGEHGGGDHGGGGHAFVNPARRLEDAGYLGSLRVIG